MSSLGVVPEKIQENKEEMNEINEESEENKEKEEKEENKDNYIVDIKMDEQAKGNNIEVAFKLDNINDDLKKEKDDEEQDSSNTNSEEESEEKKGIKKEQVKPKDYSTVEDYYEELRKINKEAHSFEDSEFAEERNLYLKKDGEYLFGDEEDIVIKRFPMEANDNKFISYDPHGVNISYEFVIKPGKIPDRFFLNAVLLLFKKREEFFTNLVLDYPHVIDNLKAGFCGFTFFINGEWKEVTIDTKLSSSEGNEADILSNVSGTSSNWLSLFEKAYAKISSTYEVLSSHSICDYLVDFTGGWARMKSFQLKKNINENNNTGDTIDEKSANVLFEEIVKCLNQNYLIGCMNYDEDKMMEENLGEEENENAVSEEQIVSNCMYTILDAQVCNNIKLIYMVNHWDRGRWTGSYSVEDETWEANKALAEKLHYTVSQTDKTFWMKLSDWADNFNRLYYCRIFPEKWRQYCIPGSWSNLTSGGAPPKCGEKWRPKKVLQDKQKGNIAQSSSLKASNLNTVKNKKTNQFNFKKSDGTIKNSLEVINEQKGVYTPQTKKTNIFQFNTGKTGLKSKTKNSSKSDLKSGLNQTKKTSTTITNLPGISEVNKSSKLKIKPTEIKKLIHYKSEVDTEDRWFLNPQYKLEIGPKAKLIISLIQEDKKLQNDCYVKTSMIIINCKGRNTRVWNIDEDKVVYGLDKIKDIKKDIEDKEKSTKDLSIITEEKEGREIIIQLDYYEVLKMLNEKRKKKIQRGDIIHLNLIPYIDYDSKYTETKINNQTYAFAPYTIDAVFWIRIFSYTDIYISEIPQPYLSEIKQGLDSESSFPYSKWSNGPIVTSGGSRSINNGKVITENPTWPLNPQFLVTFNKNIKMKIIVRKKEGPSAGQSCKIGFMVCKPTPSDEENLNLKLKKKMNDPKTFSKTANTFVKSQYDDTFGKTAQTSDDVFNIKSEQMQKVMESTIRLLNNRGFKEDELCPKMFISNSDYFKESSYDNDYCACLYFNLNKIDSPLILIPTLDTQQIEYEYIIQIFSNQYVQIRSLNQPEFKMLASSWAKDLCGGSHFAQDEKFKRDAKSAMNHKDDISPNMIWIDNPRFILQFTNKNVTSVEFEICISRSDIIWKPIVAKGVVNSMMGVYLFKNNINEIEKIRKQKNYKTGKTNIESNNDDSKTNEEEEVCMNKNTVEFLPQNYISIKFSIDHIYPSGYIIMPATYGAYIKGPFILMIKCKEEYTLTEIKK